MNEYFFFCFFLLWIWFYVWFQNRMGFSISLVYLRLFQSLVVDLKIPLSLSNHSVGFEFWNKYPHQWECHLQSQQENQSLLREKLWWVFFFQVQFFKLTFFCNILWPLHRYCIHRFCKISDQWHIVRFFCYYEPYWRIDCCCNQHGILKEKILE